MVWVVWIVGGGIALVGVVLAIGWMLPQSHVAERSLQLDVPPPAIWDAITDVLRAAEWREGVKSVELVDPSEGRRRWREIGKDGPLTFVEEAAEPHRRWVTRIDDPELPFGGRWLFSLEASGSGTNLTIREEGEVYNPVYRFVSRFIIGHHASLDAYLQSLQKHFAPNSAEN